MELRDLIREAAKKKAVEMSIGPVSFVFQSKLDFFAKRNIQKIEALIRFGKSLDDAIEQVKKETILTEDNFNKLVRDRIL